MGIRQRQHVIVIGGGFGGLAAARGLQKAPVDVTVIDRENHHLFQPLLYQVATAALSPADIAVPIRRMFRGNDNIEVFMEEVTKVDAARRLIHTQRRRHGYDYLIIASGSEYTYFGQDEWARHAPALKGLDDALEIRRRILLAFERAEIADSDAERRRLMTFVIVGGGPTGVELAGAIAELAKSALARDFRHTDPRDAKIVLVEAAPGLLGGFSGHLSDFACRALKEKGVTIRLNAPVKRVSQDEVVIGDEILSAGTVLWAAGTHVKSPAAWLDVEHDKAGRLKVATDLSLPAHPEIFVVGDAALVTGEDGSPLPGLAAVAKQEGDYVAKVITRRIEGKEAKRPFRYRDLGTMATIGRGAAIADFGRVYFKGWFAWVLWWAVHIYFLIGFRNRVVVFLNWAWAYVTYSLSARLITGAESGRRKGRSRSGLTGEKEIA